MADFQFIENIFEEPFCKFLLANARTSLEESTEFRRSNFHWAPEIRLSSAVVLVRDYDKVLKSLILDKLVESGVIQHTHYAVMNFAWSRLSYIPWHDDSKHEGAVTIFLNERWELDWGGLFLYRDDDGEIRAHAPRFNCGLRNGKHVPHATTLISLDAPEPRFTLQLFARTTEPEESGP